MAELTEGSVAPTFVLPNQDGKEIDLESFKGKTVVLYFYPKDMTPGCTQQACDFRDNHLRLQKEDVVVLGVSKDSENLHKKFEQRYNLNFSLLCDPKGEVCQKYGVISGKQLFGLTYKGIVRSTFIIGADGKIKKIFRKVRAKGHIQEVLKALKNL